MSGRGELRLRRGWGVYRGYIGIMDEKMETTIENWGPIRG